MPHQRECLYCGVKFFSRRPEAKFHSPECRQAYAVERRMKAMDLLRASEQAKRLRMAFGARSLRLRGKGDAV